MEDFVAIPCITVIVYLIAEIFKAITKGEKKELLPVLCGVAGGILGVICFFFIPEYIAGENLFSSIATGIVSGFSATGVHQIYKQMTKEG